MLHLNAKNPSNNNIHPHTYSESLIAFKPRQVLLSQHNSRTTMAASALKDENSTKITSLTPELKGALHESILHYLNRNGFSKTLKRFQSEAQIQSDAWKGSSLHLEDIFCKYSPWNADSNNNTSKKPGCDFGTEKEKVHLTNEETTTKKKKKKATVDGDNGTSKDHTKVIDKERNESSKNLGQISEAIIVDEQETKHKKKKTKHDMDSSFDTINGLKIDDSTVKTKEKKKKSIEQVTLEPSTTNENELVTEAQNEKKKKKKSSTDENENIHPDLSKTKEEKKRIEKVALEASTTNKNELVTEVAQKEKKKKKKSSTDENETIQPDLSKTKAKKNSIEQVTLEPSTTNENGFVTEVAQKEKKKKKKSTTDDNETFQPDLSKQEKKSSKKRKRSSCDENENGDVQKTETFREEKSNKEENNVQEISTKKLNGETHGKLEIDGVKSPKRQRIATAEPKTVDAFQRVKIDQVEFAHEKLQDNSYWAKDGAEIGYGAKAQEVLGQVRGRDFRHEKTKKKRGSYRGGSIDLQSHSVKFNYSDEE